MKKNKITGRKVVLDENMPIAVALRKLKQKVDDSNVLEDVRRKMFYEKPTTLRKRKASAAKLRWRKKLKENELPKKNF